MRTSFVKNGLVMVVILLFIGIAIQPAIAVNPISSDNEDDCNICPKISNSYLVRLKSLINRVEILNNKLSVMSKQHPKVEEKYKELSDRITALKEMNNDLNIDWKYPILCSIFLILAVIGTNFVFPTIFFLDLKEEFQRNPILFVIFSGFSAIFFLITFLFIRPFFVFCFEFEYP